MRFLLRLFFIFIPLPPPGSGDLLRKEIRRTLTRPRNWAVPISLWLVFVGALALAMSDAKEWVYAFVLFFDFYHFLICTIVVFIATLGWPKMRSRIDELRMTPFPESAIAHFQCAGWFAIASILLCASMMVLLPATIAPWYRDHDFREVSIGLVLASPMILWFYFQSQLLAFAIVLPRGNRAGVTVLRVVAIGILAPFLLFAGGVYFTIFWGELLNAALRSLRQSFDLDLGETFAFLAIPVMLAPALILCGTLKNIIASIFFARYRKHLSEEFAGG